MNDFTKDQLEAVTTTGVNAVVRAGAGSGKTKVLVERYIRQLALAQSDIDGIAAITFTRKSAKEMQERIRSRMDEMARVSDDVADREKWKRFSQAVAGAPISTIHSLCSRILRENPVETGIDPNFVLLEEIDDKELRQTEWQKLLVRLLEKNDPSATKVASVFTKQQIETELLELWSVLEKEGVIGDGPVENPESILPVLPYSWDECVNRIRKSLTACCEGLPTAGKMSAGQEKIQEIQGNWAALEKELHQDESGVVDALEMITKKSRGLRAAGKMADEIKALKDDFQLLNDVLIERKIKKVLPFLLDLFSQGAAEYRHAKSTRKALAFDDLERLTDDLLSTYPSICRGYNRRIKFLMVDECQDINERQRRIIYLLSGGNAELICSKNLFVVGDPKQSIYRFRGADVRVFERVVKDVATSCGKVIDLFENFRSARNLVFAFNDLFSRLMPASVQLEDAEKSDCIEYVGLSGSGGNPEATSLHIMLLRKNETKAGYSQRESEAAALAQKIKVSIEEGKWRIRTEDGGMRKAGYGDISVLLRAFTDVQTYEQAFQNAAIPYNVAGGRGFFDRQEIRDVLNLLSFIDNAANERALFAVLRSPFFMASDQQLYHWKQIDESAGLWASMQKDDSLQARTAVKLLSGLLNRKYRGSVAEFIREAIVTTGYDYILLAQFMGMRRLSNLIKLIEMAEQYRMDAGGLAEFIARTKLLAQNEPEAETDCEAGESVKILTIHKSKGLEFPIVIIPDLHRKFGARSRLAAFDRQAGLGIKYPGTGGVMEVSASYRKISNREAALEKGELKRLLYVAMTRARDHLLLSAVVDNEEEEKEIAASKAWIDWCKYYFGLRGPSTQWPEFVNMETSSATVELIKTSDEEFYPQARMWVEPEETVQVKLMPELEAQISKIPVPPRQSVLLSPSKLKEYLECPRKYYYSSLWKLPPISDIQPPVKTMDNVPAEGGAAVDLGVAFHLAMELSSDSGAGTFPEWGVPIRDRIEKWISLYRQSSLYKEIEGLPENKEWNFLLRILEKDEQLPAVSLSGQVDRIVHHSCGELSIIDYKTDYVTHEELHSKAAEYHLQLACYLTAVQAVFERPVCSVRLYFARLGKDISIEKQALAAAWKDVLGIAEYIRRHELEEEYPCSGQCCEQCPYSYACPR